MTADLRGRVAAVFEDHWLDAGYAAPNPAVYPWQWLWDSCFHALVWAELDRPDRAVRELERALHTQYPSGFVPHMNYERDPDASVGFWGRSGSSTITQPPMYGHAVAALVRRGVAVSDEVVERSARGLRFLLEQRARHASGLIALCHPWESGADDSPRWDDLCPGGWDPRRWFEAKGALVREIGRGPDGAAVDNPDFAVASVGFNALVAWNARELATIGVDLDGVDELVAAIGSRWDGRLRTWVDAGANEHGSGRVRTADALLPVLVCADRADAVAAELTAPSALGGLYGPAGVHRAEPAFAPDVYWRGPVWPQLAYLLWLGLAAAGHPAADELAATSRRGADASGLAEYWNPDDGTGRGAIPQTWAGVVLLMTGS